MTPEQILFRLRRECEDRKRQAELAKKTGYGRSYINLIVHGKRRLTEAVGRKLIRVWAEEDGRLHAVVPLAPVNSPPVTAAPGTLPGGTLSEAIVFRAGVWSRETVQTLQALAAAHAAHGVECTAGEWIDAGDRLERRNDGQQTSSKQKR